MLAALREATAGRHAELDGGLAIGAPDATLADYRDHLRMLHGWLTPLEGWLAGFDDGPQCQQLLPRVERSALIARDLAHPAMPSGAARQRSAPVWPQNASAAYRWGVCYVVEGSQLGGAVLYQRLAGQLAPHPLNYLRGDAAGPGPRWRLFMQALRANVRSSEAIADACQGARDAFDRILAMR